MSVVQTREMSVASPWKRVFRALESRNFRLFLSGQIISLVGTWMQQMAMSWLVYRLTGSPMLLGVAAFLGQVPGFVIAPFAGMLADRYDRRKILIATQTLAMAQAFALAWLTLTGEVAVWQILYLSVFLGVVTGFDNPVRQSFVYEMIDSPEDIGNAVSLNSSVFNGARLIGPALAGLAVARVGEGWCFFINAISYIAVVIALLSMKIPRRESKAQPGFLKSLGEGFSYAWRFTPIRAILLLVALVSLVGLPYSVLVPVYAREILHGGPETVGILMGAVGAGALTGAVYLASRHGILGLGKLIPLAAGLFGLGLIGFALSRTLWMSVGLMYAVGLGMMLQLASCNIILQTVADEDKRGRVMSLYTMSFLGITPFGSLLLGMLTTHFGLTVTLAAGGSVCLLGALFFARQLQNLHTVLHPIYVRKGIIKDPTWSPPLEADEPVRVR